MTKTQKFLIITFLFIFYILSMVTIALITRQMTIDEVGILSKSFFTTEKKIEIDVFNNPYKKFLDDEKALFIIKLCEDFKVNPDLAVSILNTENPTLDETATSIKNRNGTRDIGLWQLNDYQLFCKGGFVELYWRQEFGEFNADNWRNNTYIAIKYLQRLTKVFGDNNWYIAAAYNAGLAKAFEEYNTGIKKIPNSTRNKYVPSVINYMKTLEK